MRFLFVDRILELVPGQFVRGIKHITHDDPYLYKNEQGQLCFASSLIGEALGQLAAWNVMVTNDFSHRPVAGVVASACLHRSAYVGETLILESTIDTLDAQAVQYHSTARIGQDIVFTVEGALGPLLPMHQFISDGEIRRQFVEINKPEAELSACEEFFFKEPIACVNNISIPMMFDSLLSSKAGVSLCAEKRITRSAAYFPDHFPHYPVLPMTVLLECKLNLAQLFLKKAAFSIPYQVKELRKIKMNSFVYPGDIVRCHVNVHKRDDEQLILRYRSEVEGKRVCVLDVVMIRKDC